MDFNDNQNNNIEKHETTFETEEQSAILETNKKELMFSQFLKAAKIVFCDPLFVFLGINVSINAFLVYYFIFLQTTTFNIFWQTNSLLYSALSLVLTILICLLFGIAASFVIWSWKNKKQKNPSQTGNGLIGGFLGAFSIGCPSCGSFLLPLLGFYGGLAAFPFQGLEIKILSVFLLMYSTHSSAKDIARKGKTICETDPPKKEILNRLKPLGFGIIILVFVYYLPILAAKFNIKYNFGNSSTPLSIVQGDKEENEEPDLLKQINPPLGYEINAVYGNVGPRLLEAGAIDFEKFKQVYDNSGAPLTKEQIKILTEGSNEKIKISEDNSYFLINFLWALGIANKNAVLEKGPLSKYEGDKLGYFASTGGWTLGIKKSTDFYSKSPILSLDAEQQKQFEDFANNSYRPCCNNSSAFADCNHGMAALALGEIMAESGASADQMFEALKYFNAFWFPNQYFDLAKYFKERHGKNWKEVNGRTVMGKDYSSASGWSRAKNYLSENGFIKPNSAGSGTGC